MKKYLILSLSLLFLTACSVSTPESDDKLTVVSTFTVINDIVSNLVSNDIETISLLGVGLDPHTYVPTPSDIQTLNSADVIFSLGLNLEASMFDLLDSLSESKSVYTLGDNLDQSKLLPSDEGDKSFDPHVWFNIDLYKDLVSLVSDNLVSEFPEFENEILANTSTYLDELNDLDVYVQNKVDLLPVDKRILITAHDAFSYFADTYDFQLYTLQGVSTESDYSLKDVNDIIDVINENNVNAIFTESSVSNQSIKTIFDRVLENNSNFKIGGELYSDSLGEIGSADETYVGSFMHNVDTIVDNLK